MDIQIVDQDSRLSPRNIMQSYELKEILDYAMKYADISNNTAKNKRVLNLCESIINTIDIMISELPK